MIKDLKDIRKISAFQAEGTANADPQWEHVWRIQGPTRKTWGLIAVRRR